jgi:hypothetical protein
VRNLLSHDLLRSAPARGGGVPAWPVLEGVVASAL